VSVISRNQRVWRGSLLAPIAGLTVLGGHVAASDDRGGPSSLACPAGQVTWLTGAAAPGQSLLARFDGTTVGGGSAGADGRWRIPLVVEAPAGIYVVTVVDRQNREEIMARTCYVGVPVGATPTGTPTQLPREQPMTASPFMPATARPSIAPPATSTPEATVTVGATTATRAPTTIGEAVPSVTTPARPAPTEPATLTPTRTTAPNGQAQIALVAAQADDPDDPELFEYVIVENQSATLQTLTGWRLAHQTTNETYTIPAVTLRADEQLVIWSGEGEDDPTTGALFWPAPVGRWAGGDVAELRSPDGQIVSTLTIAAPEGSDE